MSDNPNGNGPESPPSEEGSSSGDRQYPGKRDWDDAIPPELRNLAIPPESD